MRHVILLSRVGITESHLRGRVIVYVDDLCSFRQFGLFALVIAT